MTIIELRCEGHLNPLGVESAHPKLGWLYQPGPEFKPQRAYQIQVASCRERLLAGSADLWDTGMIASSVSQNIPYAGAALQPRGEYYWRVKTWHEEGNETAWSNPCSWEMALLEAGEWQAQWMGRPDKFHGNSQAATLPAPLFRKGFDLPAPPVKARAYFSGLGYGELYLNGTRVSDRVLDPVFTQYDRRTLYVIHDVTTQVRAGENVAGIFLGNGWYNAHTPGVWHFEQATWRDYPKALLQIEVECADGSRHVITSDKDWKVTDGPICYDGLRSGEYYDARHEIPGWLESDYDDEDWKSTRVVPGPGGELQAQAMPPCRETAWFESISGQQTDDATWLYDFGQNIAGWVRITVRGEAGQQLTLRYGEHLDQGRFDQTHIKKYTPQVDFQMDRYTLRGGEAETWSPRFTYHGFRYLQVEGVTAGCVVERVAACEVRTDFGSAGGFECSESIFNRLQDCTRRAYRSNYVGIPTDCPHREKNGWTGDAHLAVETGLFNYDAASSYQEWIHSVADAQRPSGQLPGIVPTSGWGFNWGSGPAWDSAFLLLPWSIYLYTGDLTCFEKHYDAMARYVDFCAGMASNGIVEFGLGDWCHVSPKRMAPVGLTSTAFHYSNCRILERIGHVLGRKEAADHGTRAAAVREAFWQCFHRGGGVLAGGEQTSQACALYHDLVPDACRTAVAAKLAESVIDNGGVLDFGILGAKWVPRMLVETGRMDLAYAMLTQKEFPSWGYWLEQGATTLWEDWAGNSSENHIMFGDISAWMFRYLGGIRPEVEHPGFRRFHVRPYFPAPLKSASAVHRSPYGTIRSTWERMGGTIVLEVEVPPNTAAEIVLSGANFSELQAANALVLEPGQPQWHWREDGAAVNAGAGVHRFVLPVG